MVLAHIEAGKPRTEDERQTLNVQVVQLVNGEFSMQQNRLAAALWSLPDRR
jgi:hypothetical protein